MAEQPQASAGWYLDPEQPGTQRYWDGDRWTEQRAPLPKQRSNSAASLSPRLVFGLLGAALAIAGVFLPRADSPSLLHIADNTLIQSGAGVGIVLLALVGAAAAMRERARPGFEWALFVIGVLLIVAAYYFGTGDRIALENGLGQEVEASPGPGIWAVGIGGLLLGLSARGPQRSHLSGRQ